MSAMGPLGANSHAGLTFPQASLRRNPGFAPSHTHAAQHQANKQSPAPHAASPCQAHAFAPPQSPAGSYSQHLFAAPSSLNTGLPNGQAPSRAAAVAANHVSNALNAQRQPVVPSRQHQIPPQQSNAPPMIFPGGISQHVPHDSIISHTQHHQPHPAHPPQPQSHPGHPGYPQQHQHYQHHHQQQQQQQQQQHQHQHQHQLPHQLPQPPQASPHHQQHHQLHPHPHPQPHHQQQQQQQQQQQPQHPSLAAHQAHVTHPGHPAHPGLSAHPPHPSHPSHQSPQAHLLHQPHQVHPPQPGHLPSQATQPHPSQSPHSGRTSQQGHPHPQPQSQPQQQQQQQQQHPQQHQPQQVPQPPPQQLSSQLSPTQTVHPQLQQSQQQHQQQPQQSQPQQVQQPQPQQPQQQHQKKQKQHPQAQSHVQPPQPAISASRQQAPGPQVQSAQQASTSSPQPPQPPSQEAAENAAQDLDVDMDGTTEAENDPNSLEAKLLSDPSFVPTQPMGEMMSPPPEGGSYPTLEAVQKAVLRYCTSFGYAIVIGRSKKTVPGLKKVLFVCDRAGKPPSRVSPEFRKRKTSSRKCDCPFGFFAIEQRTQWTIRYRPDAHHLRHNHGPSESPSHHPAARKLDSKMVAAVKQLKDNGAGVSETLQILQTENPDCHLLPRDIYNARAAINRNPQKVATGLAENRPAIYTKPQQSPEDRIRADLRRELSKARDDLKKIEDEKDKEIGALKAKLQEKDKLIEKFETFIDICNQRVILQRERLSGPQGDSDAVSNIAR